MLEQPNQMAASEVTNTVVAISTPAFGHIASVGGVRSTLENTAPMSRATMGACRRRTAVFQPSAAFTLSVRLTSVNHCMHLAVARADGRARFLPTAPTPLVRRSTQIVLAMDWFHCCTHSMTGRVARPRNMPSTFAGRIPADVDGSKNVTESGHARPNHASRPI